METAANPARRGDTSHAGLIGGPLVGVRYAPVTLRSGPLNPGDR
jgi:hypothetical protein